MSSIDIILIVVCGAAVITGFIKGAVRQIGSLAGVVIGFVAARIFGPDLGTALFCSATDETAMSPVVQQIIGCIAVFTVVWLIIFIVVRLIRGIVNTIGLGFIDRLAGAAIMLLKALLLLSVIMNIWYAVDPDNRIFTASVILNETTLAWIMNLFPWLMNL